MKTLSLMRHAKSSWKDAELNDLDRPLLEKGLRRTRTIIAHLQEKSFSPEYILCSHARRSLETARIMAHAFGIEDEFFRIEKNLYTDSADDYFDRLFDLPEKINHVLMVGHNPSITNFVNAYLKQKIDYLPTSGIVILSFDTGKWEELPMAQSRTMLVAYPKMLK
jgi:phosphohistidine phosphatase